MAKETCIYLVLEALTSASSGFINSREANLVLDTSRCPEIHLMGNVSKMFINSVQCNDNCHHWVQNRPQDCFVLAYCSTTM